MILPSARPSKGDSLQSLSVVVPVYGQREALMNHIQHHRALYEGCGETIWVATPTTDCAHQLARQSAERFGGAYVELGPGLYEAWNSGISRATKKWVYLNTTGDFVDLQRLQTLLSMASLAMADVAFTPPDQKKSVGDLRQWPILKHASSLRPWNQAIVPSRLMIRLQLLAGDSNLLGSLAGGLFSVALLQKFPFPTDFKSFGDTAWTFAHCGTARFFYSSTPIASFLSHDASRTAIHPRDTGRLLRLLASTAPNRVQTAILGSIHRYLLCRRTLNWARGPRPGKKWLFSAKAWGLRLRRQKAFADMSKLILDSLSPRST